MYTIEFTDKYTKNGLKTSAVLKKDGEKIDKNTKPYVFDQYRDSRTKKVTQNKTYPDMCRELLVNNKLKNKSVQKVTSNGVITVYSLG